MSISFLGATGRSFYIAIFEIYTERGKAEKLFDLLPDGGELSMQQSTIRGQKEVYSYICLFQWMCITWLVLLIFYFSLSAFVQTGSHL
jgi:hypothetical protein